MTDALKAVAISVLDGYAVYGVELRLRVGKEPAVNVRFERGGTLGDALELIFRQLPEYSFDVISSHLISVYPKTHKDDPNDLLNLHVARFDVDGMQSGMILAWPEAFIPELKERLNPNAVSRSGQGHIDLFVGAVAIGPRLTLHLRNMTVRQILNAVSKATEDSALTEGATGWVYSFQPQLASPLGGVHSWRLFMTLPSNWLKQAEKARKSHVP